MSANAKNAKNNVLMALALDDEEIFFKPLKNNINSIQIDLLLNILGTDLIEPPLLTNSGAV